MDVSKRVVNNDVGGVLEKIAKLGSGIYGDFNISYTLPGNATVQFSVFLSGGDLAMGPAMVATTALPANFSNSLLGLQNPLLTLAVLQFPNVGMSLSQGNYFTSLPTTNVCSLYFCVNTYNVTVTNTVSNTTVIDSWVPDDGTPVTGTETSTGFDFDDSGPAILRSPPDGLVPDGNHTYFIPAGTLVNLKAWLNNTLQGSLNTTGSEVDNSNGLVWVNDVMEAFNVTSDWNALFNGLAKSMTTYIRSSDLPDSVFNVTGTAWHTETFVRVKWPWIILPSALVLFSIVFLAVTVVLNSRRKVMVWKNKSLASLFHGLEARRMDRKEIDRLGDMEDVASGIVVRLAMGSNGEWKLVGAG
jgi:hypothetical protein